VSDCLRTISLLIAFRALTLYNAAVAAANATTANPVLVVGQQQMASFVHNTMGRAVLALPGQDVEFVRGSITPTQVGSHRPSYINAILIQSRGTAVQPACEACTATRPGLRPFPECRRVAGHFGGACANCKWRDHGARCFVRDDSSDEGDKPLRLGPPPAPAGGRGSGVGSGALVLAGAGTAADPLVLA
jgi:hypothetical protein